MTATVCPYCHSNDTLGQLATFLLPEREQYADRQAELMQCESCQQVYVSVNEERIIIESETKEWNVYHYYLPTQLQSDVFISATLCRTPDRRECQCDMHTLISEIDFFALQRLQSNE